MSLSLYLDDCAFSHKLKQLLAEAGHDVEVPVHFAHAKATGRAIITLNARDFKEMHDHAPDHSGILIVYQDNDPTKDMSYSEIVQAIANLENTDVSITGGFWSLNAYRW